MDSYRGFTSCLVTTSIWLWLWLQYYLEISLIFGPEPQILTLCRQAVNTHRTITTPLIDAQASLATLGTFSSGGAAELACGIFQATNFNPFWPMMNALEITDAQPFEKGKLPSMGVCFRSKGTMYP